MFSALSFLKMYLFIFMVVHLSKRILLLIVCPNKNFISKLIAKKIVTIFRFTIIAISNAIDAVRKKMNRKYYINKFYIAIRRPSTCTQLLFCNTVLSMINLELKSINHIRIYVILKAILNYKKK